MKIKTANLKEYQAKYYQENKEKIKKYHREYGQKFKTEIKERRYRNAEARNVNK